MPGFLKRHWKWLITILGVALLASVVDWRGSIGLLRRAEPGWVLAAWGLDLTCILVSAYKWQLLLHVQAIRLPLLSLFRTYWVSAFVGSFLPSTVGGDVVRAALVREHGGREAAAASVVVERLTGFAVLLAIVLVAILARPDLVAHSAFGELLAYAIAAGCAALLGVIVFLLRPHRQPIRLRGPALLQRAIRILNKLEAAMAVYARSGRALLVAALISAVFNLLIGVFQYAVIQALGFEVALVDVMLIAPLVTLVAALPIAPNGLGVAEGTFVVLYAQAGLSPEVALAAALLRRVVLTLTALTGGVLWLVPGTGGSAPARR